MSGKDLILTWQEVQPHFPKDLKNRLSEDLQREVYNHWKRMRELIKRPLLRLFWRTAVDDNNPHAAFRPRDREKMKLRR
jgi:hypothetical protein